MASLIEMERTIERLSRELTELRQSLAVQPSQRARPTAGSGLDFGIIRQIDDPAAPYVWVTLIEEIDEDPWWRLPANTAEAIRTQPQRLGRHFQGRIWTGTGEEEYPLDWAPGMRILPIMLYRGRPRVMDIPLLPRLDPLPLTLPQSDGRLVDSGVAVELLGA